MRTQLTKIALAATFGIALAFTISCHDGGNDDPGTNSPNGVASGGSSSSVTNGAGGSSPGGSSSSVTNGTGGSSSSGRSSSSVNISVSDTSGTFNDSRDGQTYKWVKIGEQIWMAENLKFNAPGSKCYDNLAENCNKYGRLYNWVMAANHCPDGWHLPSDAEWTTLKNYIGNNSGTKLKATNGWDSSNGTDNYEFTALPGGYSDGNGAFGGGGTSVYWWTSSHEWSNRYHRWGITGNDLFGGQDYDGSYLSVRCVEGAPTFPAVERGSFVDTRDNSRYETVKIGAQTWMARNLNYNATGSKCYNNLAENCAQYGRLYNWKMATKENESNQNPSGVQGVCPNGWHVPSDAEWTTFKNYIGDWSGRKLKSKSGWNNYDNGTDNYGFTALPSGYSDNNGAFGGGGTGVYWWTSSHEWSNRYHRWGITGNDLFGGQDYDGSYLSIRCVEDIEMP